MIVTRTPLRISLVGGGTDMPSFYNHHTGTVVSMGIDKYVYLIVKPKFDGRFRISYSQTENVDTADEIKHDIVRETMKLFGLKGLEIVSMSDIPGEGSGLGSSSAFTVGLLRAVMFPPHNTVPVSARVLAETAFKIEAELCRHPVGKQDHYAAAFGSLMSYDFSKDGVSPMGFRMLDEELQGIASKMMLFWTGTTRHAGLILSEQAEAIAPGGQAESAAIMMAEVAKALADEMRKGKFDRIGKAIRATWVLKKSFSNSVSNPYLDDEIERAMLHGAEGGKVCGAGGGGFVLIVANPKDQQVIESFSSMRRIPFKIGVRGSRVVWESEA